MKNRTVIIMMIILLTIVVLGLTSLMIYMINGRHYFGFNSISDVKIIDKTYEGKFEDIKINTDASDIEIVETSDHNIRLVVYGDEDSTELTEGKNRLNLVTKVRRSFGLWFNRQMSKVVLYLPRSFENHLEIQNKYGNIDVGEFPNIDLVIEEDCGDVEIKTVKTIDIINKYGNISIDEATDAKVKNECGNIKMGTLVSGEIKNSLGDVSVQKITKYFDISLECGTAKISEIDIEKDSMITNNLGDIKIGSTNEIYIDAKTSLGDIKIENNYRHSNVTLRIKNSAGDIKVAN